MTLNSNSKSPVTKALCAMALGMSIVMLPNLASAADHAAPIQPAAPIQSATSPDSRYPSNGGNVQSGSGGAALSDSGSPISTGAWCDPIDNTCERHPWTNSARGE
jgi:hypothetical protein